jgi:hypothetical protein
MGHRLLGQRKQSDQGSADHRSSADHGLGALHGLSLVSTEECNHSHKIGSKSVASISAETGASVPSHGSHRPPRLPPALVTLLAASAHQTALALGLLSIGRVPA